MENGSGPTGLASMKFLESLSRALETEQRQWRGI